TAPTTFRNSNNVRRAAGAHSLIHSVTHSLIHSFTHFFITHSRSSFPNLRRRQTREADGHQEDIKIMRKTNSPTCMGSFVKYSPVTAAEPASAAAPKRAMTARAYPLRRSVSCSSWRSSLRRRMKAAMDHVTSATSVKASRYVRISACVGGGIGLSP